MKALLVALALYIPLAASAQAQGSSAAYTGFNPRFGTKPANPDQPNYRPPDWQPRFFDFSIDLDIGRRDRRDRDGGHWHDRRGK